MAAAGAAALRERTFGEDICEVLTDVFYAMQAADHRMSFAASTRKPE
jgi:hypothetical protein